MNLSQAAMAKSTAIRRRRAALRLIVKVKITERLTTGVTDKLWGNSDIVKVLEDWEAAE